jgi:hypothetical protein
MEQPEAKTIRAKSTILPHLIPKPKYKLGRKNKGNNSSTNLKIFADLELEAVVSAALASAAWDPPPVSEPPALAA